MSDNEKLDAANDEAPLIEIAAGLVLAAMSIVALLWLIPYYVELGTSKHDVGPAFFPRLTAFVVLGFSILLVITKALRYKKGKPELSGASIVLETIIWATISILVIVGISNIGFLITSTLLVGFGAIISGYRTWWVIALLAVAFPVIIDQMAWLVFTVDLP
ncbi:MAG: tripartite tricarboxylate transporter TctB family protein [Rhizobiaceae bacterium]